MTDHGETRDLWFRAGHVQTGWLYSLSDDGRTVPAAGWPHYRKLRFSSMTFSANTNQDGKQIDVHVTYGPISITVTEYPSYLKVFAEELTRLVESKS